MLCIQSSWPRTSDLGGEGMDGDGHDVVVVGSGYGGSVAACRMAMDGINVCLVERGRRWEAKHFPTNSFQMVSAVRMDFTERGVSFGKKDALFQIYVDEDSLAGAVCGLGGGSLVNAGVMVSTPIRARRHPKWPKEWDKDWARCEASAMAMLRPENVPVEFSNVRVMKEVASEIEDGGRDPLKLTVNFGDGEDKTTNYSQQLGRCLACGNCMSGCSYNAKRSLDKSYLDVAIKGGCEVRTGCQVKYVVKNPDGEFEETTNKRRGRRGRRWRVYLDNFEYITTDFVVLSAGVLGTAKILFQSERRGLRLSEKLGHGFSCNGNNVAYVTGCRAPLNVYGLDQKHLSSIPFQDRPGPAITSSFTSSLGFTIQSAVVPVAYPCFLFKGITTYQWPSRYSFLRGLIQRMKHLMGIESSQGMVFNAMGRDECDGRITLDKKTDKIRFTPPRDPLLHRKIDVFHKLTKRLGGVLFLPRFRSTSVHLLGGCSAASDPFNGVCNSNGQVFYPSSSGSPHSIHHGLYVCDASLIPCSVGINPCLTIATIAEHVCRNLVQEVISYKRSKPFNNEVRIVRSVTCSKQGDEFLDQLIDSEPVIPNEILKFPIEAQSVSMRTCLDDRGAQFADKMVDSQEPSFRSPDSDLKPPIKIVPSIMSDQIVTVTEILRGYVGGMPCEAHLVLKMNLREQRVINDVDASGGVSLLQGKVGGLVMLRSVDKDKMYVIEGKVDMCSTDRRAPYTQFMDYHLQLASASGSRYVLNGRKIMNPYLMGLYCWRESTTLRVTFKAVPSKDQFDEPKQDIDLKGELYLSPFELLRSLTRINGTSGWKFVLSLLGSLLTTYILQIPRSVHRTFDDLDMINRYYPTCILHELKTEDGAIISCKQWKSNQNKRNFDGQNHAYPVLLLNGHSTDSFCLPTEPHDLVRTLIAEGCEVWLLQPRLHPLHASLNFTIDDVGKYDIPAAMRKIQQLNGQSRRVHIVAHCAGGLAAHIALMGGHVSSTQVASLSCTNSSMFFKLTPYSLLKMKLPLIPIAIKIMGKNTILPMLENTKISSHWRHRLIKTLVRLIPRYERCTCDECEVFSGIFGNTFWHTNISNKLHYWLNKVHMTKLPLSTFHQLRKICLSGCIVDSNGNNSYLIHPERMAVHTLYVSGGRSLLVTPETSFLAHQYVKLHQPGLIHKRVVVEGFGHSDLLMGEESYGKVFPHILSHIRDAEEHGDRSKVVVENTLGDSEALSWAKYEDEYRIIGYCHSWALIVIFIFFIFFYYLKKMLND